MAWQWCRRDEQGAQAVEFALLFSLVLGPLIYMIIAFGLALYQQVAITQMARQAARTEAICRASGGSNCTATAETEAKASYPSTSATPTPAATNSSCTTTSGSSVNVSYTVTVSPFLPIPGLSTLTGKSTTPCGG